MVETKIVPQGEQVRKIIRLAATDIDGNLSTLRALRKIKGISFMLSNAVCTKAQADPKKKIGLLSDPELKNLEELMKGKLLPIWMINRRKEPSTGEDRHLIGVPLDLQQRDDINLMKKKRSYKGIRHELGQPVRGQSTRTSFRKNKTVKVGKKKKQAQREAR